MTCEIVCELSSNHNGELSRALALIDLCAAARADAVKFQCWHPGRMVLNPSYVLTDGPWRGRNLFALYNQAHTPWEWFPQMIARAKLRGIKWFASVFDHESLAFLEEYECPRYKIASFELVDLPLIRAVARTGKPVIMSTGMATEEEIDLAVAAWHLESGCTDVTLLKCTSAYPADASNANLRTMERLSKMFAGSSVGVGAIDSATGRNVSVRVGVSDHTQGIAVAVVAATLGCMIEKHVKLMDAKADEGLDATFSIGPIQLENLVKEVRRAEVCMGREQFGPTEEERAQVPLRRSLYFARSLIRGEVVTPDHLCTARPALGIEPVHFDVVCGKTMKRDVWGHEPVKWSDFE